MNQRGYVLGIVVVALVALSIGGSAILTLSGGEADLAGQVRRQKQLQACAIGGVDAGIARLPDTTSVAFNMDDAYGSTPAHYALPPGATPNPISIVRPELAADAKTQAAAGSNVANVILTSGAAGLSKQPFRLVSTCTGPNGQHAEAEKVILYGAGQ